MDFQQLRHMLAAAETESFTRAAERCETSRQNIAHSVKLIERELGTTLFERRGSSMVPTVAGKQILAKVNDIISRVDSLYAICAEVSEKDDQLSVALSTNLFAGMSPATDVFFLQQSAKVQFVERDTEGCYRSVLSGESDLAIVMCMERMFLGCVVKEMLTSAAFALVNVSSHLAEKESLEVTDLRNQDIVVMSNPEFQYAPLVQEMSALGYNTNSINIITSTSTVIRLIRSRGVMGIVSDVFAYNPPVDTTAIPLRDSRYDWHFYAIYKSDSTRRASILEFVEGATRAFEGNISQE